MVNAHKIDLILYYINLLPLPVVALDENGQQIGNNKLFNIYIGQNAPQNFKELQNTSGEEIFRDWLNPEFGNSEPIISQKIMLPDGNYLVHAEFLFENIAIVIFPEYLQGSTKSIPHSEDMVTNIFVTPEFLSLSIGTLPVKIVNIESTTTNNAETTLQFICLKSDTSFFENSYWQKICQIIKDTGAQGTLELWTKITESLIYQSYSTTRTYALLQYHPRTGDTCYFGQAYQLYQKLWHTEIFGCI